MTMITLTFGLFQDGFLSIASIIWRIIKHAVSTFLSFVSAEGVIADEANHKTHVLYFVGILMVVIIIALLTMIHESRAIIIELKRIIQIKDKDIEEMKKYIEDRDRHIGHLNKRKCPLCMIKIRLKKMFNN